MTRSSCHQLIVLTRSDMTRRSQNFLGVFYGKNAVGIQALLLEIPGYFLSSIKQNDDETKVCSKCV